MPEQTAMYHFTVSPPRGPGQDDVSTLLRQVADTLDALGAVTVHDITFHVDMTEDGSWPLMSVYYEVEVTESAGTQPALDEVGTVDDDIEVIETDDTTVDAPAAERELELVDTSPPPPTPLPPVPPAPARPAAYVDMISAFTREPSTVEPVSANVDDDDDDVARDDTMERLADVVDLTDRTAATVSIATVPAATFHGDDETRDDDVDIAASETNVTSETSDASEVAEHPETAEPAATIERPAPRPFEWQPGDDHLPVTPNVSTPPSITTFPPRRTQLPADRTSLRRLKELWRTNPRRRNGT